LKEPDILPEVSRDVKEILEEIKKKEEEPLSFYEKICRFSVLLFGSITEGMELEEDTRKKLSLAGFKVTPAEWWAGFFSSVFLPIIVTIIPWVVLLVLGTPISSILYFPIIGLILSAMCGAVFYYYPVSTADIAKSEAQSRAIETIMLMSFALHHRPDLRGAAIFASNASDGKLAEDLREGFLEMDQRRSYESVRELLTVIAHNWGEIDEGVRRAIFDILRSTGQTEETLRQQDVAKAPDRVLDSAERQLGSRLDSLIMPTMTFMVFGSLVIVGVIGLSPIFGMIGMNFIDIRYFALAAAGIIISFLAFTTFIGRKRPATVPPPSIPEDDPRVPPAGKASIFGKNISIWIPSLLVFLLVSLPGFLYLADMFTGNPLVAGPNTFWIVWGLTGGLAVYGHLKVGPRAEIRDQIREATRDWTMALNVIGSRIIDGRPMRQAMKETSGLMEGSEVGGILGQATDTMDKFSTDASYAFFETGLLGNIYNPLVANLLGVITRVKKGSEKAAGRASMQAADFLDTLNEVERRFRERIGDATGNLWMMGLILLPVVCALSVWVMDFMGEISISVEQTAEGAGLSGIPLLTGSLPEGQLALLTLVMGITVISLILIVVRHISVIKVGRDPIEFWDKVPLAVISGTTIFTLSYLGFSFLTVLGV